MHAPRHLRLPLLLLAALAGPARAQLDMPPERQAPCLIEPHVRLSLRSPVAAVISQVLVERGATVKKGQPLVVLESAEEAAQLESARYRSVMEGQLTAAQARVAYLKDKLERRQALVQQSYVSAQDRDDVAAELRVAEAELAEARDARQLSKLEVRRLSAVVAKHTIVSPINGVVTERLQHPGEMAQAGDAAMAVLKLAQTDPLKVELVLPVSRHGRIKPGDTLNIRPEAPFKGVHKAVVRVVDPVIDPASGTFGVRAELPNPSGLLPAGARCAADL